MNGYDDDDPFDPALPRSPENVFRRCPFAGKRIAGDSDSDSSDSDAFHVESTGIFMVSLPDSLEDKDDSTSHLYQTAPEELLPTSGSVPADAIGAEVSPGSVDDVKTVDLGRDTDVGLYSEAQSATEISNKDEPIELIGVCRSYSSEAKKSGLPFDESVVSLGGSSFKKLRLSDEGMDSSSCARTVFDKFPVHSTNSGGGSKLAPPSSVSHNNENEESDGKCRLKRMNVEDSNGKNDEMQFNYLEKSAEKVVKESENTQSHQQSKLQDVIANGDPWSYRMLPSSITGMKKFNTSEDHPIEVTLLEVLKIFKGEDERKIEIDDRSLSNLDILDIVQRRGMTFPRPEWWPPEG